MDPPGPIPARPAPLGPSGLFCGGVFAPGAEVPSGRGGLGVCLRGGAGRRAGRATGWMFLAGVVGGAPIVCLIGASYVTDLTGGGQAPRAAVAAVLLLTVLGLAAGGR